MRLYAIIFCSSFVEKSIWLLDAVQLQEDCLSVAWAPFMCVHLLHCTRKYLVSYGVKVNVTNDRLCYRFVWDTRTNPST